MENRKCCILCVIYKFNRWFSNCEVGPAWWVQSYADRRKKSSRMLNEFLVHYRGSSALHHHLFSSPSCLPSGTSSRRVIQVLLSSVCFVIIHNCCLQLTCLPSLCEGASLQIQCLCDKGGFVVQDTTFAFTLFTYYYTCTFIYFCLYSYTLLTYFYPYNQPLKSYNLIKLNE